MSWRKFQKVAAQTFRQIGCNAQEDIRVKGARSNHDLDVLVSFVSHGFKVRWILECKDWEVKIPKEKVMALKSIVEDLGADKGILISKVGFQPAALESAKNTNIELIRLDDLKQIIASSVLPIIDFSQASTVSKPEEHTVSGSVLKNLRNPKPDTFPDIYREYLLLNGCQKTQKAAASGLSKIQCKDSVLLLVERLGNFWGMGSIKSSVNALSKLASHGGVLGLLSTLLLDSRFYYEKLEAAAKAIKSTGDTNTYKVIRRILDNQVSKGMEMSYRLSKVVTHDIESLLNCDNHDVKNGVVLAAFFNQSTWAESVIVINPVDESIEYADETLPGLLNVISNFNLTKFQQFS